MKNFVSKAEENLYCNSFDVLSINEMFKIRGGGDGDVKSDTRDKDIYEFDED